jgi:hypothetical protein
VQPPLFHLIQALAGPDAVPTGSGTGITTHDTSIVTISEEQPDAQASSAAWPHHCLRQQEPTVTTNSVMKWYSL